jgi:hypothetical protein
MSLITINLPGYPVKGRFDKDPNPKKILDENLAMTTLSNKTAYIDNSPQGHIYYLSP